MVTESPSHVDIGRLKDETERIRDRYQAGDPFQHVVLDDFLAPETANRTYQDFPRLDRVQRSFARLLEARSFFGNFRAYGPVFEELFDQLQGPEFIAWLRTVTGIDDLEMDSELIGGGFHQGARGSSLHTHADHNTHPNDPTRYRRINVLVYANKEWERAWGGDLELFDEDGQTLVSRVAPVFNRAVIMDVHDTAFHGYRTLKVPDNVTRKTLAAYFYSKSPGPKQSSIPHPTILAPGTNDAVGDTVAKLRRKILYTLPGVNGMRPQPNVSASTAT